MEITGILHCHSHYSYDAKLTLKELRALCISRGVRFVCMTEHTDTLTEETSQKFIQECAALSDAEFLFIPGFEVPYQHAHILMIGCRSFYGKYAPDIRALQQWTAAASFVVLAHPVRNHFAVDHGLLGEINALEVWNQQYEGKRVPRMRSLSLFEVLKEKKPMLVATSGVDFHRAEHFGTPFVTLSVNEFSEEQILEKIKIGAFVNQSDRVRFFGTLPNSKELRHAHWIESSLSVSIIVLGKLVNKILAHLGLSLPKAFREIIRRRL